MAEKCVYRRFKEHRIHTLKLVAWIFPFHLQSSITTFTVFSDRACQDFATWSYYFRYRQYMVLWTWKLVVSQPRSSALSPVLYVSRIELHILTSLAKPQLFEVPSLSCFIIVRVREQRICERMATEETRVEGGRG